MLAYRPQFARTLLLLAAVFTFVCVAPSVSDAIDVAALSKNLKRQAGEIKKHRATAGRYKSHADAKKWKKYKEADKMLAYLVKSTYKNQRNYGKVKKAVPMLLSAGSTYQTTVRMLYLDLGLQKSGLREFDAAMKELNKITFPKDVRR